MCGLDASIVYSKLIVGVPLLWIRMLGNISLLQKWKFKNVQSKTWLKFHAKHKKKIISHRSNTYGKTESQKGWSRNTSIVFFELEQFLQRERNCEFRWSVNLDEDNTLYRSGKVSEITLLVGEFSLCICTFTFGMNSRLNHSSNKWEIVPVGFGDL